MKRFFTLYLFIFATLLNAEELDNISLITPALYEKTSSSTQTFKSKFKVGLGDLINLDVASIVKDKIAPYSKDLSNYFSGPAELDAFVDKIISDGKNNIIGNSLTDEKMIRFYEHIGSKLIGGVADKVLATEGIKDPERRELWLKKILAPFQACIGKSKNSQYDAAHCMDALTSSLVPSAGMALVYELSRSNLDPALPKGQRASFNIARVDIYTECIKKNTINTENIKTCALSSMKSGILKVSDLKLSKTINDTFSSTALTKSIKQAVWPDFNYCIQKVGVGKNYSSDFSKQFLNCIDELIESTGMQMVKNKINTNTTVKEKFSKTELVKLTFEQAQSFKNCIKDLKKKNLRVDGILDTSRCETSVTNDVTYNVVAKTLVQLANDSFKSDRPSAIKVGNEAKLLLDKCWSNNQDSKKREECLRSTILAFSQEIATVKLDNAIPNDLKNKKELTQSTLAELATCLEAKLPINISEANNLDAQASACTNKITRDLSLKVARELVMKNAKEHNISESEAQDLIKNYVESKFSACIGTTLTDEILDNCSGELKRNVILTMAKSQIREKAAGKINPAELNVLVNRFIDLELNLCLGSHPTDLQLNGCVDNLSKSATKAIVLSNGKKQIEEQLNTEDTPLELSVIEDDFVVCVERPYSTADMSKSLDECTKQFALEFARGLGKLKFNLLMKSVLGLNSFNEQKNNLDQILATYNECLDELKKISIEDHLLDKLTVCTDELQHNGKGMVSNTINTWMSEGEKNSNSIKIKNDFANFIPCLGNLMPATPYTPQIENTQNSILKPMSLMISQYIEYSPENAKLALDEITKKLSNDLKDVASNPDSKKALIDSLYANGALNQFLKSMVRSQVKEAFDKISESQIPKDLRAALLSNENFDKIFASPEGQIIKDIVMEKILKPALMEQASMDSPMIMAGLESVKNKVVEMLIKSKDFGEVIIKTGVQKQIDSKVANSPFYARWYVYAFPRNWDNLRTSTKGRAAEVYIRDNILLPKIKGIVLTELEIKSRTEEAEKLIKSAIENKN